jgi:hypothetical protein
MEKVYIITSYRWGERDNHSYNVGILTNKEKSIKLAKKHAEVRGIKYECVVEEWYLNITKSHIQIFSTKLKKND